jgi:hypothetical protein
MYHKDRSLHEQQLSRSVVLLLVAYLLLLQEKTLIPVIDFCNHSNIPNASWIADETTGGVCLMVDVDIIKNQDINTNNEIELTINYGID